MLREVWLRKTASVTESFFLIKMSGRSIFPEQVDVIISEIVSKAVIGQSIEELTALCRDRFLKPDGRLVPQWIELLVAPVELPEQYTKFDFPPFEEYELNFASVRELVHNAPKISAPRRDFLLIRKRLTGLTH